MGTMQFVMMALPRLLSKHHLNNVEDASAVRKKKCRTWGEWTEPDNLLTFADDSVVSSLSFGYRQFPLLHLLRSGKRHIGDSLQEVAC